MPSLLPPKNPAFPKPDVIVHIGLAAGRRFFALEDRSTRDIYDKIPDVDGELFTDKQTFSKFPAVLTTSFDAADVLRRWKALLSSTSSTTEESSSRSSSSSIGSGSGSGSGTASDQIPDVRISQNPGNFMCGFIYYNSLAHYFSIKEDNERPVVFFHVPDLSGSEEKLRQGREVTIALITALVESMQKADLMEANGNVEAEKIKMDLK